MGEKNARNNFSRNIRIVRAKNLGKRSSGKRAKKRFLYSHEYRDTKRGGNLAKQVFQKHTNSASKKCWEKDRLEKGRKNVFYLHTNIVTKKRGKKRAKQFCQQQPNSASKKLWGKNRRKILRKKTFLFSHEYRDQKWGEKMRETIFPETHQ